MLDFVAVVDESEPVVVAVDSEPVAADNIVVAAFSFPPHFSSFQKPVIQQYVFSFLLPAVA